MPGLGRYCGPKLCYFRLLDPSAGAIHTAVKPQQICSDLHRSRLKPFHSTGDTTTIQTPYFNTSSAGVQRGFLPRESKHAGRPAPDRFLARPTSPAEPARGSQPQPGLGVAAAAPTPALTLQRSSRPVLTSSALETCFLSGRGSKR